MKLYRQLIGLPLIIITSLFSMHEYDSSFQLYTQDKQIVSAQMLPDLIRYSQLIQEQKQAVYPVPFSRNALFVANMALHQYHESSDPQVLALAINQYLENTSDHFPLRTNFFWFKIAVFFKIPVLLEVLTTVIATKIKNGLINWLADEFSDDITWNIFIAGIQRKIDRASTHIRIPPRSQRSELFYQKAFANFIILKTIDGQELYVHYELLSRYCNLPMNRATTYTINFTAAQIDTFYDILTALYADRSHTTVQGVLKIVAGHVTGITSLVPSLLRTINHFQSTELYTILVDTLVDMIPEQSPYLPFQVVGISDEWKDFSIAIAKQFYYKQNKYLQIPQVSYGFSIKELLDHQKIAIKDGVLDIRNKHITSLSGLEECQSKLGQDITCVLASHNQITKLPEGIFKGCVHITQVVLDHNAIQTLPSRVFQDIPHLTRLDVHNNCITTLDQNTFDACANLQELKLDSNQIRTLPAFVFRPLSQAHIYLKGNPVESIDPYVCGDFDKFKGSVNGLPYDVTTEYLATMSRLWTSCQLNRQEGMRSISTRMGNRVYPLSRKNFPLFKIYMPGLTELMATVVADTLPQHMNRQFIEDKAKQTDISWVVFIHEVAKAYYYKHRTVLNLTLDYHFSIRELLAHDAITVRTMQINDKLYKMLDLSNLHLRSLDDLEQIPGIETVEILDLSHNNITSIPSNIGPIVPRLRKLILSHNAITRLPEQAFAGCKHLDVLELTNNQLTDLPDTLFNDDIGYIYLSANIIRSLTQSTFKNCTKLRHLTLDSNRLTSIDMNIYGELPALCLLNLRGNLVPEYESVIVACAKEYYYKHNHLLAIDATSQNDMTYGFSLAEAAAHGKVTVQTNEKGEKTVSAQSCNLTSLEGIETLVDTDVHTLNLSNNRLTTIPESFSALSKLTHLYLGHNNLKTVPPVINSLSGLKSLDLSHNTLQTLPVDCFSNLIDLSDLRLNNNYLKRVPDTILTPLEKLFSLDMSYNQLEHCPKPSSLCFWSFNFSYNNISVMSEVIKEHKLFIKLIGNPIYRTYKGIFAESGTFEWIAAQYIKAPIDPSERVPFGSAELTDLMNVLSSLDDEDPEETMKATLAEQLNIPETITEPLSPRTFNRYLSIIHYFDVPVVYNALIDLIIERLPENPEMLLMGHDDDDSPVIYNAGIIFETGRLPVENNNEQWKEFINSLAKRYYYTYGVFLELSPEFNYGFSIRDFIDNNMLDMNNITALDMKGGRVNSLDGIELIPDTVTDLDLSHNMITELRSSQFRTLPNLTRLILSHNAISDLPENGFEGLPNLKLLSLSHNALPALKNNSFTGLGSLETLHAIHNQIALLEDRVLSPLMNIKTINLSHNNIQEISGDHLRGLNLDVLNLTHNDIEQIDPSVQQAVRKCII